MKVELDFNFQDTIQEVKDEYNFIKRCGKKVLKRLASFFLRFHKTKKENEIIYSAHSFLGSIYFIFKHDN